MNFWHLFPARRYIWEINFCFPVNIETSNIISVLVPMWTTIIGSTIFQAPHHDGLPPSSIMNLYHVLALAQMFHYIKQTIIAQGTNLTCPKFIYWVALEELLALSLALNYTFSCQLPFNNILFNYLVIVLHSWKLLLMVKVMISMGSK